MKNAKDEKQSYKKGKRLVEKVKKRIILYTIVVALLSVIIVMGIVDTIKELPSIDGGSVVTWVMILTVDLLIIKKLIVLYNAYLKKSFVNSTVEKVLKVKCSGDEQGSYYYAYRVFVRFKYNNKEYKNIFWYALDDERTKLSTVFNNLPQQGQQVKLLVNPSKPHKIVMGIKPKRQER